MADTTLLIVEDESIVAPDLTKRLVKLGYQVIGTLYVSPSQRVINQSVGITIEPTGGSPGPTGAKVLGGDLPR